MDRPSVGVAVLLFNEKGQILLAKRTTAHGGSSFGTPGGHLEPGETFEACAIREVKEEVDVTLTSCTFLSITNDYFPVTKKHYVSIFMTAQIPNDQPITNMEPQKAEQWNWFDTSALPSPLFLPLQNLSSGRSYPSVSLKPFQ